MGGSVDRGKKRRPEKVSPNDSDSQNSSRKRSTGEKRAGWSEKNQGAQWRVFVRAFSRQFETQSNVNY